MNKSLFSDRELLHQLSKGSTKAFKILFDQYYPVLVRVLMRYSSDQEEIRSWIQEIYIGLWESRDQIQVDSIENFKAYFMVSARNFAIRALSKKKKRERFHGVSGAEVLNNSSMYLIEENEVRQAYQTAIARLPAKTQKAYVLSRETGLTFRGITEELGISIKTVETQISRAMLLLRQELYVFRQ